MTSLRPDDTGRGTFVAGGTRADVAAVVVAYNSACDIGFLIDDLRRAARDRPIRLVVVDNQSSDDTVEVVRAHDDVVVVESGGNLGYAGGINVGLRAVENCDAVLILNSDLGLAPDAVTRLVAASDDDRIGAVVPLIVDGDGVTYPSLRREPTLTRALGDALFGSRMWRSRPGWLSEIDHRPSSYARSHDVDWATGAALLVPAPVAHEIGDWDEDFFLYSEETDYSRRIRQSGRVIRFEPSAVVKHRQGGSGTSPALAALMAVNRVRYVERQHGKAYSALFRGVVALGEALRSRDAVNRRTLTVVLNRRRWHDLPRATKPSSLQRFAGPRQRGAVIVPAYNEAAVIKRTLGPLSPLAVAGFIELVVVCNGCTDDTADVARGVEGARVIELEQGSKPAALNAGDEAATLWPRLYLDADIQISAATVLAVLDRLDRGDILVARPDSRYDFRGASALVRSYYRARQRVPQHRLAMWGAGAYGLSETGHQRFGAFPTVTDDDLYVDTRFDADEKTVVTAEPSVVKTPADPKNLLAILRRGHRGDTELVARGHQPPELRNTGVGTAVAVLRAVRGPFSAADAVVYLGMALASRVGRRDASRWERDDSSRSTQ
jgi:GT2 family glycosyltransferase